MQITQKGQNKTLLQQDSNNTPLVSIIIPAYNTAPYVFRAIESSLRQTHPNIEVLVIDDGSTDDTLRVAESYAEKDKRVRVFHQENAGVSAARNHGIREAHGEYLMFLDSDDWLEDEAVEILLDAQMKYPDKLIMANYYMVREENSMKIGINGADVPSQFLSIEEVAESFGGGKIRGAHNASSKIFRKELLFKHNIRFMEGVCYAEDAPFMFTYLSKMEGLMYVNKPTLDVFERSGSATRSSYRPNFLNSLMKSYNTMINLPENTPEIRKLLVRSKKWMLYCLLSNALRSDSSAAQVKEIRKLIKSPPIFIPWFADSIKKKAIFFLKLYFPVSIVRGITSFKSALKKNVWYFSLIN